MTHDQFDSLIVTTHRELGCVCDLETYEIYHLTKALMEIYQMKNHEEYAGHKCYALLRGLDAPCSFCRRDEIVGGEHFCWEYHDEKLGLWLDVEDSLVQVEALGGRLCHLSVARDVTPQKQCYLDLQERLLAEEFLGRCMQTLSHETDMDAAVHGFLKIVGEFYEAIRAYIFEFDFANNTFANTFEWCAPGVTSEQGRLQGLPMSYLEDWMRRFEKSKELALISVDDEMDRDSEEYQILKAQGIESLLAVPLTKAGQISGFLGVDNPTVNNRNFTLMHLVARFIMEEMEKRRLMEELEYASYTDMLTGLQNRNQYIRALHHYEKEPLKSLGVVFVDINGMKALNDHFGHKYGDMIIIRVATILKQYMQEQVFRIGGDEFVALCENMDKPLFTCKVAGLRAAFEADPQCDVSIGSVWREGDIRVDAQVLLADEMMYAEKQSYYRSVFEEGHPRQGGMAGEVMREIAEGHFVVCFQPQVNIKTGKIVGAEALVRKKGVDGRLILPDKFISLYEKEGVIRHVDLFVLESVCEALQQWKQQDIELEVSVNVSRLTLVEPNIVERMQEICGRFDVSPKVIKIEVTDSIARMEIEQLRELLRKMKEAGFGIALDAFGSRNSDLAVLSNLDFGEVKFDKTLIAGLEGSSKNRIIMKSSIEMCQNLSNTQSLAQGIETQGQLELLVDYACDLGQGYYFYKPLSFGEFDGLLRRLHQ